MRALIYEKLSNQINFIRINSFLGSQWRWSKIQGCIPPEDNRGDDSNEMEMKSEEEDLGMGTQSKELIMEGVFGDEQVFPFPPGLGN